MLSASKVVSTNQQSGVSVRLSHFCFDITAVRCSQYRFCPFCQRSETVDFISSHTRDALGHTLMPITACSQLLSPQLLHLPQVVSILLHICHSLSTFQCVLTWAMAARLVAWSEIEIIAGSLLLIVCRLKMKLQVSSE